jgi:LPXTG-motif cell wall-anchored protein
MRVFRAAVVIAAVLTVTVLAGPAFAAPDGSGYGHWTVSGGSGTVSVPLDGFPSATVTTNSTRMQVPGGTSAFLGASTPFGQAYGSSQGKQYLVLGNALAVAPSTTTVTFGSPTPTGWGFALGDVDADTVRIAATGANGQAVSAAELGWQSAFNYCQNTPRPTGCTGAGPFTDMPRWDPATATLIGNVADTSGASGWFRPTVAIKSVTFTFTAQTGIPSYQVWIAALPVSIAGAVATNCDHPAPQTTVRLLNTDGSPVLDAAGEAVTTTSAADGTFSFPHLTSGHYVVAAESAQGYTAGSDARRTVDASTDVTGANLALTCPAPPTTTTQPPAPQPPPTVTVDVEPGTPTTITLPDGLVATHVDKPDHGTANVNPNGTITYVPDNGFAGTDHIRYTARTRSGAMITGVITIRINLPNTGANVLPVVGLGTVLVIAGVVTLFLVRRRSPRQ